MVLLGILLITPFNLIAQTAEDYLQKAKDAEDHDDFEYALTMAEKAFAADSSLLDAYFTAGYCAMKIDDPVRAVEIFSLGIELFPDNASLYSARGNVFVATLLYEYAVQDFSKALLLTRNDTLRVQLYVNRSTAHQMFREFELAYDDLLEAYAIDSLNFPLLNNLGAVCSELGKNDEAIKFLRIAANLRPEHEGPLVNIGFILQEMGKHKKAIEYFNMALELNPEDPFSFSNRGYSKYMLGDYDGALSDVDISLEFYPSNPYAHRTKALIYIKMGKKKLACNEIETAIDLGFTTVYGDEAEKLQEEHCK